MILFIVFGSQKSMMILDVINSRSKKKRKCVSLKNVPNLKCTALLPSAVTDRVCVVNTPAWFLVRSFLRPVHTAAQ